MSLPLDQQRILDALLSSERGMSASEITLAVGEPARLTGVLLPLRALEHAGLVGRVDRVNDPGWLYVATNPPDVRPPAPALRPDAHDVLAHEKPGPQRELPWRIQPL